MKKLLVFLLSLICCFTASGLYGCSNSVNLTFVAPDGAPALAISKLICDKDRLSTNKNVDYNIVSAKEIQTYLSSGTADLVLAPVNLASKLYKASSQTDHYVMVAVITHGNFYIMSTKEISASDLSGETIAVPMQGAVPDWTMQMTLKKHNLFGSVNLEYYAEPSNIVPLILSGAVSIGLIPEPAATNLVNKAQNQSKTIYRLDLQELYDSAQKSYPQAVLMVKKSVIENNPTLISTIETKIAESVGWAKTNTADAVSTIANKIATTLSASTLSAQAIDGCNIYWQSAISAKASVQAYIEGIREIDNTKASQVQDDFFYIP